MNDSGYGAFRLAMRLAGLRYTSDGKDVVRLLERCIGQDLQAAYSAGIMAAQKRHEISPDRCMSVEEMNKAAKGYAVSMYRCAGGR